MMPKRRLRYFYVWLMGFSLFSAGSASSTEIKFCAENINQSPYIVGNSDIVLEEFPGLVVEMLRLAGSRLDANPIFMRAPWKRCLLLLQRGNVDGVFMGSYSQSRTKIAVFPTVDGKVDPSQRIVTSSYSFYRLKGSALDWDGKNLVGDWGDVGATRGYSIVKDLRQRGIKVREYGSPPNVFNSLMRKEISAAAVHTSDGDRLTNSELFPAIERIKPPIVTKHYYVMFSHSIFKRDQKLVESFWHELAVIRENEAKQMLKKYLH